MSVDEHATTDHVTADHVTADHVTADHDTADHVTADHVEVNRRYWDESAEAWVAGGERSWASAPVWGVWRRPNDELPLLPPDLTGKDCVELGCGTGYGSAWMAARGARRLVAVDNSAAQLATASRLAAAHGVPLGLVHADAEHLPLPDGCMDFALSEYGAAIWCDPDVWLREAWRVLRPGGALVFLGSHPLAHVTAPLDGSVPSDRTLHRGWFDLHRLDWTDAVDDPGGIEFSLPTAGWVALFNDIGFRIEDYREPQAPAQGDEPGFAITRAWASRWPSEQVWWLRRPA